MKPWHWAALIACIAIAYYFIGEIALTGLLVTVFGLKKKDKQINDAKADADAHEEMQGVEIKEAVHKQMEADAEHIDTQKIADDITQPNTHSPNRRRFTAR